MEDFPLLKSILFPKEYEYELSEKLFNDIWESLGKPKELTEGKEIFNFLDDVIEKSKGYVILDHFSHINYDNIHSIKYEDPYTYIYWKDNNTYREKYLKKTINEDEMMFWQMDGYATYSYMLLHIQKIKFIKLGSHLVIIFLLNLIPSKKVKKTLLKSGNELISEENNKNDLYKEIMFWEGDKEQCKKHIAIVNNLPYYSCLIQPKEGCFDTVISKKILLNETINEIYERMQKVHSTLLSLNDYEYDDLFSQGNTIRRILEFALKFLCIYRSIELNIDEKYGHIKLGELRKEINARYDTISITQGLVNIANELSHDSGEVFSKEEVVGFWEDVNGLLEQVKEILLKNED